MNLLLTKKLVFLEQRSINLTTVRLIQNFRTLMRVLVKSFIRRFGGLVHRIELIIR